MVSDYRTTATQSPRQYRLIVSGHPTVTYTSSTATYNNSTGETTYAGQGWMDFWYETVLTSYQPVVWQEEHYPTADEDYHAMLWWKFENRRRMKATPYFKTGKVYSGLHCQFNGVNSAFRSYFQLDSKSIRPIQVVKAMAKAGLIVSRGAYIYKAGTVITDSSADNTLRKMGLA